MRRFKPLMNSKLVSGTATRAVINPATEDVLADAPLADRAQLDEAVAAAKAAFPAWSAQPIHERGTLWVRLADALKARQGEFRTAAHDGTGQATVRGTGRSTLPSTLFATTRRSISQMRS
jgi:acyl-CoA reductase-like NAD-dependent aldehyde dehydrogenase